MFKCEQLKTLADLLKHLHRMTRISFSLYDADGHNLYSSSCLSPFCVQLRSADGACARCCMSENGLISEACRRGKVVQSCHAGLLEAAVPVTEHGRHVATVLFGEMLRDTPIEQQWMETRALCAWHPNIDALRPLFHDLRVISQDELDSCLRLVYACISDAQLEGMPMSSAITDGERLTAYIDQYYAMPLSLDALCRALSIGKTKLCAVARKESGMSISHLIAERRVRAAQELLKNTDAPIQEIAERVGIPDYNYFSKVFKSSCSMTPSEYRRLYRA